MDLLWPRQKMDVIFMQNRSIDMIHQEIRDRICTGYYTTGQTLYETSLGREFEVSRTPIRQVLQRLALEQMAVTRTGVGTMVIEASHADCARALAVKARMLGIVLDLNLLANEQDFAVDLSIARRLLDAMGSQSAPDTLYRAFQGVHTLSNGLICDELLRMTDAMLFYRVAPRLVRGAGKHPNEAEAFLAGMLAQAGCYWTPAPGKLWEVGGRRGKTWDGPVFWAFRGEAIKDGCMGRCPEKSGETG